MEKPENSNKAVPSSGARSGAFGHAFGYSGVKKRGHGSRSWIKIEQNGNAKVMELDKSTIMKNCSLPSRDLRLLDPLFIYPSAILGREKAIEVNLEQIRCVITSDEAFVMNSLDGLCHAVQDRVVQSTSNIQRSSWMLGAHLADKDFAPNDVRAHLVDKDFAPKQDPPTLEEASKDMVDWFFSLL